MLTTFLFKTIPLDYIPYIYLVFSFRDTYKVFKSMYAATEDMYLCIWLK